MWNRVSGVLCLSVFAFGLAALPADASETRVLNFSLQCDGTERTVVFTAMDLNNGSGMPTNRFVQGVEVSLRRAKSLQHLRVQAAGNPQKTFVTMGVGEISARNQYTGFFQVMTDATGNVVFELIAACKSAKPLDGILILSIFS